MFSPKNTKKYIIILNGKSKFVATIRIHICLIILVIFNSCERNSEVIKRKELGIYCCTSGIGVSMVANRNREIRAVNACIKEHALFARLHEEANVLCLGQKYVDFDFAIEALKIFMTTKFDGGRHLRRINKY